MDNTILLIDGSSFIFRSFYAIKYLSSPGGMPTNAIYGIVNMLKLMQKKYPTPYWVCVFDAKGKTFRDDLYPKYKATRPETPQDLIVQIPYIHELVVDLGIPVIVQEGVEADDVIATIAKKYAAQGYKILIATGDKDFAQIVDENITLINTMNGEMLDIKGVEAKFGVKPEQIIDYLSLVGDTVDNVPGVKKCGPKTAVKWLQEFGSLQGLMLNHDKLLGSVGENFREVIDWLPTAQKLITIDCNVDISVCNIHELTNLTKKTENLERLLTIYKELNFRTWLREVESKLPASFIVNVPDSIANSDTSDNLNNDKEQNISSIDLFSPSQTEATHDMPTIKNKHIAYISTLGELKSLISSIINAGEETAFNIILEDYADTKSPISMVTISSAATLYLIPIGSLHTQDLLFSDDSETPQKMLLLAQYWHSNLAKICVDYKKHLYILERYGVIPCNIVGDLTLLSYIENSLEAHDLFSIINRNLPQHEIVQIEIKLGRGAKRVLFNSLSLDEQRELAVQYNLFILELHKLIFSRLTNAEQKLYRDVELPLVRLLFQIENEGMLIDIPHLKELSQEIHSKLIHLENKVHELANIPFNLNSPKQLQEILFNNLKLPTAGIKKNISGFSTDEESLSILAELGYPIANLLLEYRYLSKLLNTYIERLPGYADKNGFVHTSLEQTIVTSGRLSSKDPNLQNIPVKNEYGQAIRECFIAKPGHHLVCADYSQIELRILAHISHDENLINAFKSNADIHLATASQIFNKPLSEITKDERRYAKTINFGLIYGKSVFGLAKELKIDRAAAKLYIDNYFAQFPKVKDFMEDIKKFAHEKGYVETIYGRKIYLANINSGNSILRQAEERLALNAPMQGSAADIIKIAMLNVDGWLIANKLRTKMVLQVHDELIFQVPDDELSLVMKNIAGLMSEGIKLKVPLNVDVKSAQNWGDAH